MGAGFSPDELGTGLGRVCRLGVAVGGRRLGRLARDPV